MQRSPSLAELQRWLRWALTHPLGVHRAAAGEHLPGLPARFIEPDARALSFIAGDLGGRDAAERLSVHGTGYFARLHGTLRLEYPRLAGALGEDEFRVLIAAHLLRAPSRGPSLADVGEDLVETLRLHPAGKERPWLVDLAALERALAEVWLSGPSGKGGGVCWLQAAVGKLSNADVSRSNIDLFGMTPLSCSAWRNPHRRTRFCRSVG